MHREHIVDLTFTPRRHLTNDHNIPAQTNVTELYPSTTSATRALSRPSGPLEKSAGGGPPPGSIHAPVRRRRVVRQLQLAVLLDGRQDVGDGEGRGVLELELREVLLQQRRLGRQAHRQLGRAQFRQRLRRTRRVAAALRGHPTGRHSTPLDGSASSGSRGESGARAPGAGYGHSAGPAPARPYGGPRRADWSGARGRPGAPRGLSRLRCGSEPRRVEGRASCATLTGVTGYCIPRTLLERSMIGARLIRLAGMFELVHIVAALVFVN